MEYNKVIEGDICKVKMVGRFTFTDHIDFKTIFNVLEEQTIQTMDIDCSKLEFVDSAALGLLLLLKDLAEKKNIKLLISRPQGQVQKMFKVSRFYDLFNVVD